MASASGSQGVQPGRLINRRSDSGGGVSGGGGGPVGPTLSGGGASGGAQGSSLDNGAFGVDVTTPQGLGVAMGENARQAQQTADGFGAALFGAKPPDGGERQGGVPIISDIARAVGRVPVVGTLVGGPADVIGHVGGGILGLGGNILDTAGGLLEHATIGAEDLRPRFQAMPDSPEKQAAQAKIAADPAIAQHVMYGALTAYAEEQQKVNPVLFPAASVPSGSLADAVTKLAGLVMGGTSKVAERTVAGLQKANGLDRLREIEAVHNGAVYAGTSGSGGNTPIEELAYQRWHDGTWSPDQALDFLSASGAGFSHNPALELAGSVALDPMVWGSVGAAGFAKFGIKGLSLAVLPEGSLARATGASAEKLLTVAIEDIGVPLSRRTASTVIEGAQRYARALDTTVEKMDAVGWEQVRGLIPGGERLAVEDVQQAVVDAVTKGSSMKVQGINVLGRLAESEKVSNIVRAIGGHVYAPLQASSLGRAAKIVRTIIDPLHAIGGNTVLGAGTVEVTSEATTRAFVGANGELAHLKTLEVARSVSPSMLE